MCKIVPGESFGVGSKHIACFEGGPFKYKQNYEEKIDKCAFE